jgi:NAD(P)-dependent dehydrogenase (short-subunit alcohol dehydrogenase family)
MREIHADVTGRTALVTGGRVKIGFQTVLRLLRDGANVILTTRFPHGAAARFHEEADSADWRDRLRIHGLDLRNLPVVEEFACHLLQTEPAIDILIHNAAQTIKRPPGFYSQLIAQEQNPRATVPLEARKMVVHEAPATLAIADSTALLPGAASPAAALAEVRDILPADALHDNEERADSRDVNSWLLRLDEVGTQELLEVQLVNSIAPFVLNSRLKPLMMRSPFARRFIVNVSAMEGQFGRHKTVYHPHTTLAKASLNMMTHTSAEDYAKSGIYMNSVDTGWVTDENPTPKRLRKQEERGFFAPLDIVDGMARIYHPIADGINKEEEPLWGKFLKDYTTCRW